MRLTGEQRTILAAMQQGDRLKVHRTVDGIKQYLLHGHDESATVEVDGATVGSLERAGLIESNMKFPAATFLLTDKGIVEATQITGVGQTPVGSRNFS